MGKNTWRIFYLLIGVYFALPAIVCFLYPKPYAFLYKETDFFIGLLVIPFVLLCAHFADVFVPSLRLGFKNPFRHLLTSKFIMAFAALSYLLLGIWFFQNYSLNFRHQESLSDAGGLAFLLFGFRSWFKAYLLLLIFKHLNGINLTFFDRAIIFVSMVSLALAPVSSFDVIFLPVSFLLSFKLENLIFPREKAKSIVLRILNLLKPVLGVLLVVGTVYSGTANKIGTEATNKLFLEGDITELFFVKTVQRASTWMVSVMGITKEPQNFIYPDMAAETVGGVVSNLGLRMCKLFGTDCGNPPKYWSVNRRNFYYVYAPEHWDPRTGSSPGIFASIFYIPYFPVGVVLVVLYILFVLRRFSGALQREGVHIDMIGLFLLLFFVSSLFESPIDYLNFLSPSFIYALFFFAACSGAKEMALKAKGLKINNA